MDLEGFLKSGGPSRHLGAIHIGWSDNRHAYGVLPVPIAVLTGRPGPTVLLVAGTHGDEFEGQLALRRLIREVSPSQLTGRLIILPALNLPAVRESARVSPIDGLNLNRAYPGSAKGSPTSQIAHVVTEKLLPISDYALDLHSGGSAAVYLPSAYLYGGPSPERFRQKREAAETLGMPWSIKVAPQNGTRTFTGMAEELGVCTIATELAGGGMVTPGLTEQLFGGLMRLLHSWNIMQMTEYAPAEMPTQWIQMDPGSTVYAETRGLFDPGPSLRLGSAVAAGEHLGWIYPVEDLSGSPAPVAAPRGGIVGILRRPPMVEPGDGLFSLMTDISNCSEALAC